MEKKVKKAIALKTLIIVIILAIIVALISVVIVNTTEKTSKETIAQAMGEKEDYIKTIEKVETNNAYMDIKEDKNGDKVPIPKGYVGSDIDGENTVQDGYVIYEKTSEEISGNQDVSITEDNKLQARKDRNQYVWVPVDKEQLSQMYGTDSNGKHWGKLYNFRESYDNETGTSPNNWSESEGVMRIIDSTYSYREPDIVSNYDNPQYFRRYGVVAESTEEHLMNLEREYEVTLESIAKYGGFYIGRYETGGLGGEAVVRKMNTDIASQPWYVMYEKCKELRGANKNVTTSMIFGSQFDRVLMWLIESGDKTKAQVATDSKEWGNYSNVSLQYDSDGDGSEDSTKEESRSTRIPAGSSEQTKAKNIYDLCGNVWDWTIEAYYTNSRVLRGGNYGSSGGNYPASYRGNGDPSYSNGDIGCRAALYVR